MRRGFMSTSETDRIMSYDVVADPDRLSQLSLAVLSAER
jgi:RNA polymerase sigma-70 factor (ECF subfamily)